MKLSRSALALLPLQSLHEARNWSKADVSLVEWPPLSGKKIVVKDLRRCPLWFRRTVGRRFLKREWDILRRLDNWGFAPRALHRIDADAIGIEFRAGVAAKRGDETILTGAVLLRIENAVRGLHERGIMHGDLHGGNILIAQDEKITFIDWATAVYFGCPPRGPKARLFEEGRALDLRSVAKMKNLYAPETLGDDERELLEGGGSRLYRGVKKLRHLRAGGRRQETRETE